MPSLPLELRTESFEHNAFTEIFHNPMRRGGYVSSRRVDGMRIISPRSRTAHRAFVTPLLISADAGAKRSLASREFALGIEALERFVRRELLPRTHECVFGVLALENEPVDPRL